MPVDLLPNYKPKNQPIDLLPDYKPRDLLPDYKPEQSFADRLLFGDRVTGPSALKSLPGDIKNIGEGTIQAVLNPIETAQGLGSLVRGGLQNTVIPESVNEWMIQHGVTDSRQAASDFAQPFKEDFGSVEGLKNAIATHPATTLINASTLLSGFSGAVKKASKLAEPAVKATGRTAGTVIGEFGTHTGGGTIQDAARAGFEGGAKLKAFTENMSGKVPVEDIVAIAEKGKAGLIKAQRAHYLNSMANIIKDKTVLNYRPIEKALEDASRIGTYEGHTVKPSAVNVANQLKPIIDEWSGKPYPAGKPRLDMNTGKIVQPMNPAFPTDKAHTIEGLDKLKQRVGDLYDSVDEGTPEKTVLNKVYGSVRDAIVKQNKGYSKLMDEEMASRNLMNELNKELSLSSNTTDSTTLRKLLSVPRNNANTNYGMRVNLAKALENNGAKNLMSMLNGQALNSFKPRGLGSIGASGASGAALYALGQGNVPAFLSLSALTATQSPKLMGHIAIKTGQVAKLSKNMLESTGTAYDKLGLKPAIISAIIQNQERNK